MILPFVSFFIFEYATFHENVSNFTRPQSQGNNISDVGSELELFIFVPDSL